MSGEIHISVTYPHPPERVWKALTDPVALEAWLMPNDFVPEIGHQFTFRTAPAPGFDGIVQCQVLALDPPWFLSFSWRGGPVDTTVCFTLEAVTGGTKLTLDHRGFSGVAGRSVGWMLGQGWKRKTRTSLPQTLDRLSAELPPTPEGNSGIHEALPRRMRLSMSLAGRITRIARRG